MFVVKLDMNTGLLECCGGVIETGLVGALDSNGNLFDTDLVDDDTGILTDVERVLVLVKEDVCVLVPATVGLLIFVVE